MMIVQINDKWRVDIDSYNHKLEVFNVGGEVIKRKDGNILSKPSWVFVGFYPNMMQCLRKVVREEALLGVDVDLEGYLKRLEQLNEEVMG